MKIYKIISLILALIMIISLSSCIEIRLPSGNSSDPHDDPHNNYNPVQSGGNGDETDSAGEGGEGNLTYVYSVLSKTLHLSGCYHTSRMNDDYKFEFKGDINILLGKGYTICKDCLVPDDEEEEDPEEDEEELISRDDATYAYNKVSLVIHTLECHHLEIIIEKNLRYTDLTMDELLELEYRPCGVCLREEYKEYKKNHPEEFEK